MGTSLERPLAWVEASQEFGLQAATQSGHWPH